MAEHIKHEKTAHKGLAWLVTLTSSLFFFYAFIQMNLFSTINAQLRDAFNLSAIEIGNLFSMYFYANFIFLLAAGSMLDRYSTRRLLLMALTISTIGSFMFSLTNEYWVAATGRFLVGTGGAFCFLSCIRIASRWFPPQRMALVTGVIVTLATLGGLIAQAPFAWLTEATGSWRTTLNVNSFLGLAITIAVYFIVQDRPPDASADVHEENKLLKELGLWACVKRAALNPQNWLGGIYTSLMNIPVFVLGGLWGVPYLMTVHHLTDDQAQMATSIFFVGMIFGSLLFGWFSDHIERRVLPMIIGAVVSIAVVACLMLCTDLSVFAVTGLFALIGFTTSSQVLSYPTIAEINPPYLTSTAVSIDSLCIMSSGFIVPPLFGYLMEHTGTHSLVGDVTVYSAHSFNCAMLLIPAAFILALISSLFIRETYCRAQA